MNMLMMVFYSMENFRSSGSFAFFLNENIVFGAKARCYGIIVRLQSLLGMGMRHAMESFNFESRPFCFSGFTIFQGFDSRA